MSQNIYSVYMHVNKENNMKYIGCTKQRPEARWGKCGNGYNNGQEKFFSAIKEFGWDNFEHIIIASNLSKEDAWMLEEKLIAEYDSVINGYNAAYGGEKNHLSEESKQKLREQRLGEKNPNYNPNIPHGAKRIRVKGKVKTIRKIKTYTFLPGVTSTDGRKSIEFSQRQRETKLGANNPNYGKHAWCYGIKMKEKQKEKMFEAWTDRRKELARQQKLGAKNPQAKKVLCVTTNVVYDTIVEAAKANNVSERTVSDCCNGRVKKPRIMFAFIGEGDN